MHLPKTYYWCCFSAEYSQLPTKLLRYFGFVFSMYVLSHFTRSYLNLCNPTDCSLPGSSVHGILQARVLEWVAVTSFRDLPNSVIEPASLTSPVWAGRLFFVFLPLAPSGSPFVFTPPPNVVLTSLSAAFSLKTYLFQEPHFQMYQKTHPLLFWQLHLLKLSLESINMPHHPCLNSVHTTFVYKIILILFSGFKVITYGHQPSTQKFSAAEERT